MAKRCRSCCGNCGLACGRYNDCNFVPAEGAQFTLSPNTATATGQVTAITVPNHGTNYYGSAPPAVTLAAPPVAGTTATATAVLSTSPVTGLTKTGSGSGYQVVPGLTIAGTGVGATGHVTLAATSVGSAPITAGGSGYASVPGVTFAGGGGTGAAGTAVLTGDAVTAITMTANGTGYTSPPSVSIDPPASGTPATATALLTGTTVATVVLDLNGSGFTDFPSVTITPPTGAGGTNATATANINNINVASITVVDPGSGYSRTSPPAVTIAPPASGATATATSTVTYQGCVPYPSAGTFTLGFAPPAGVSGRASGTVSTGFLACDGARHPITVGSIAGTPQANVISTYACCQGIGLPIKKQLFVTLGGVLITLNLGTNSTYVGGTANWTGSAAVPVGTIFTAVNNVTDCTGTGSATISVLLQYQATGNWLFSYSCDYANCSLGATGTGNGGCGDWFPVGVGGIVGSGTYRTAPGAAVTYTSATFTAQPFNFTAIISATQRTTVGCPTVGSPPTNYNSVPSLFTGTIPVTE